MSARRRLGREERGRRATAVATLHGGVAHRADLRSAGVSRDDIRSEVHAGRWAVLGRHTVGIATADPEGQALWWQALWESGSGAVLDGAVALCASGLKGFDPWRVDVSMPHTNRHHRHQGVVLHRRAHLPRLAGAGLPRVAVEPAALHAACWARSDREAALVLCLVIQQRLTSPARLLAEWRSGVFRSGRRDFLETVVVDICDGAQALGELDFAHLCRAVGLPEPTRQVVRTGARGRVHLDAEWEELGLVVEVDGGHHQWALNPVHDALRQNDLVVDGKVVLRIPVVGLRLGAARFTAQVVDAHRRLSLAAA